jgi:hypothetical protein
MAALDAIAAARVAGYRVFVVGIATMNQMDFVTKLNMMAEAGGVPRMGDIKYYEANSGKALTQALVEIASRVASCTFPLGDKKPPAPDRVVVAADGKVKILRDTEKKNGWDYTEGLKAIQIYGEECAKIGSGKVQNIKILFGCPPDAPIQ